MIRIPYNYKYCSVQNGEEFVGSGWTVRIGPELEGSYIVKGECQFLAPAGCVKPSTGKRSAGMTNKNSATFESFERKSWFILTLDATPADEDGFLREVVFPFEKAYKTKRPKAISELFFGSKNMWYLEVGC